MSTKSVDQETRISRVMYVINDTIKKLQTVVAQNRNEFPAQRNDNSASLIDYMQQLRDIAIGRLQITASDESLHRQCLAKAQYENREMHVQIDNLINQIKMQQKDRELEIDEQRKMESRYQWRVNQLLQQLKSDVIDKTRETEEELRQISVTGNLRQIQLLGDVKVIMAEYKRLLLKNLNREKELKANRTKTQMKVIDWLTRFDADVRRAQEDLENLKLTYRKEMKDLANLKMSFAEQEVEYNRVLAEKEADRIQAEEEAKLFLQNYSAKIIQRCWRAYRRRLIEMKKAKKKKGKGKGKTKK